MAGVARDPVSVSMDRGARSLLARAYRADGGWAVARLQDPSPAEIRGWAAHGIDVLARDPVKRGGFNARTRWVRGFTRALWYQHKWFSVRGRGGGPGRRSWRTQRRTTMRAPGIEIEVGRHRPPLGVIPAGYVIRVRLADKKAAEHRGRPEREWAWANGGARRGELDDRGYPLQGGGDTPG